MSEEQRKQKKKQTKKDEMKSLSAHIKETIKYAALVAVALGMAACDPILDNEDEDCDVRVKFIYDYHMEKVNSFHLNVEAVTLYIFDADSTLVWKHTEAGDALKDPNYRMKLPFDPKDHHLVAWGHNQGCPTTELPDMKVGEHCMKELTCRIGGREQINGCTQVCEIGPIFHGKLDNPIAVKTDNAAPTITMPMMKNTNTLVVNLSNTSADPLKADDFSFTVTDDNGLMAYDNTLIPDTELTYVPFASREASVDINLPTTDEGTRAAVKKQNSVIAELSLGRLMADRNPRLTVTNLTTGETVFSIPLVDYLKLMRSQHETGNMSDQEYLDREDSYAFTFFLDEQANWLSASILINSWRVVLQDVDL